MTDELLYDIVAVENGKIVSITVWKRVELPRAIRLCRRQEDDEICKHGLMLNGTSYLNRPVKEEMKEFEFKDFMDIQGRKVLRGNKKEIVRIFEPIIKE